MMWIVLPAQGYVQKIMSSMKDYPIQMGNSLSAGDISYDTLRMEKAKGQFEKLLDQSVHN